MSCTQSASSRLLIVALLALCLPLACHTTQEGANSFPVGSTKAVSAARQALPGAVVTDVSVPKEFGAEAVGGTPLFWVVKLAPKDKANAPERSLSVTPDGVVILMPQEVGERDMPKPIAAAVAEAAASGKILRRERQETRATLKYAALDVPEVLYVVDVATGAHVRRLEMTGDGKTIGSRDLGAEKLDENSKAPAPTQTAPAQDGEYPAAASLAVHAVKQILPHVTIKGVEEVGFLDGTGQMSVLNYEVEFFEDGIEKEWNATPDGIVISVPRPIEAAALPAAVRDAVAKNADSKIRKAVRQETRAGLKFVPLAQALVVYEVEFEKDGKTVKGKWNPDGSKVEEVDVAALLGNKGGADDEGEAAAKPKDKKP